MDRLILYPNQVVPLEDELLEQNMGLIALSNAISDILNSTADPVNAAYPLRLAGFIPEYLGGMRVNFGPGRGYMQATMDATPYSTLGTDSRQLYIQAQQEKTLLRFDPPPTTIGWSRIDVIQAKIVQVDDHGDYLRYTNPLDANNPFQGPQNNAKLQPTQRRWGFDFSIKKGTEGAAPVAPTVDAGYTALFQFTLLHATVNIDATCYAVAPGAPFFVGAAGAGPSLPTIVLASFGDVGFPVKDIPVLTAGVPYMLFIDQQAGAYTVNFPANPDIACMITVKGVSATLPSVALPITLNGNTDTIDGVASMDYTQIYEGHSFIYTGAEWSVIS